RSKRDWSSDVCSSELLRPKSEPNHKTQEEIAAEVGVHRATLFRWRGENQAFIEFKKEVARDYMGDMVGIFAKSLRDSMIGTNGAPSMKALDLYAKMQGFVNNDSKVDVNIGGKIGRASCRERE